MATGKTKKAGHGEGEIELVKKLPDGRSKWRWRIWAELHDGTRRRLTGTFTGTKNEVRAQMHEQKAKAKGSGVSTDPGVTVAQLLERWLEVKAGQDIKPRTISIYRQVARHITREGIGIGAVKVKSVSPGTVDDFYHRLNTQTNLERTREQVHIVLSQAMDYAVRQGILTVNPCSAVDAPRSRTTRQERLKREGLTPAWHPAEAAELHRVALRDAQPMAWAVAFGLHTGLRRGELLGLKWKHVDLEAGKVQVLEALTLDNGKRHVSDPKNAQSRRMVPINADALAVLRAVRAWQDGERARPGWVDSDYVFTTRTGEAQHPNNMKRKLSLLCRDAGIRYLPPHSLRHTFVSVLVNQGVSVETVSFLIGHKNSSITRQVYAHLFTDQIAPVSLGLNLSAD